MFLLFNREENYIATLKHVLKARHTEEINGEDTLEIITLDTKVVKDFRIAYKTEYGLWKEFIIKEVEEVHGTDGVEKKLFCESSFYETIGDYVEDKRPSGVMANIALANALEPTRWEVGTVDNLGIASTSFYRTSAKESVQEVVKNWKGEIQTRVIVSGNKITHRYVDLLSQRGKDFGKRFTYTKDLESVVKTVHRDDVITALYGYGKGEEVGEGHGRRIDFSEINNSKAYVEDLEALAIWGRNNPDGSKSHVFGKVEFDDCEDLVELLQLTTDKLEELSSPLITYEAKVIDLGGADLGDTVAVIDKEFTPELRLKARVVKIVRDLLEKENNDITLGNFIPNISDFLNEQRKYIDNFRGKQGVWDRSQIIGDDGTINAQFLNNLVDELNNKMNAQGGYVYISDDGKGLTTYNKPIDQNPTSAIQLLGGAFRIANSKNPDGSFKYTTFGDGNGFVADSFVGGLLKGGKVNFDLTNGTLLIGNSVSDYQLYFDGTNLKVKGGSQIGGYTIDGDNLVGTDISLKPSEITIGQASLKSDSALGFVRLAGQGLTIGRGVAGSGSTLRMMLGTAEKTVVWVASGAVQVGTDIVSPTGGMVTQVGSSSNRYGNIYLSNQPDVSSDQRLKNNIHEIPKALIYYLKEIKPKMYLQKDKWHFGYIAQDVERALYKYSLKEVGFKDAWEYVKKFAFLHKDESYMSLLYGEIAVLKEAEMQGRIDMLEDRLAKLEMIISEK